jgi:menaquinone-dependent protoporphyrinogen oxidase
MDMVIRCRIQKEIVARRSGAAQMVFDVFGQLRAVPSSTSGIMARSLLFCFTRRIQIVFFCQALVFSRGQPQMYAQKRVLLAYDTYDGQTEKIANVMARDIRSAGLELDLMNVKTASATERTVDSIYNAVILGGPIHFGHHPKEFTEFVKRNYGVFEKIPVAFFSVSMAAGSSSSNDINGANEWLKKFLDETGLKPTQSQLFGGAVDYNKYNCVLKLFMKFIVWTHEGSWPSDTPVELTNWEDVTKFAHTFLAAVLYEQQSDKIEGVTTESTENEL